MNSQHRPSLFALPLLLLALCAAAARGQQPGLVVQTGHSSPVNVVAFSPDGRRVAARYGGIKGDAEPKDGEVRMREWLDYATRRVPEMRVEEVARAMSRGVTPSFDDSARTLNLPARSGQQPRVFYRRESEASTLLVARPPSGRE